MWPGRCAGEGGTVVQRWGAAAQDRAGRVLAMEGQLRGDLAGAGSLWALWGLDRGWDRSWACGQICFNSSRDIKACGPVDTLCLLSPACAPRMGVVREPSAPLEKLVQPHGGRLCSRGCSPCASRWTTKSKTSWVFTNSTNQDQPRAHLLVTGHNCHPKAK